MHGTDIRLSKASTSVWPGGKNGSATKLSVIFLQKQSSLTCTNLQFQRKNHACFPFYLVSPDAGTAECNLPRAHVLPRHAQSSAIGNTVTRGSKQELSVFVVNSPML